ncbi:MAG: diacylglycerol kinase [Thermosediminibacterales bacterium]|nr:diacylglycerol kinase [Thermosediminibacterales bacterium]
MKVRKLIESFYYAASGIMYVMKTQKNMRIHFFIAVLVILLSLLLDISKTEMMILVFAISLVVVAEMINTAVEKTIDLYTKDYHPLAKTAKNVAAGAVLIAALNSLVVAYFVFLNRVIALLKETLHHFGFMR